MFASISWLPRGKAQTKLPQQLPPHPTASTVAGRSSPGDTGAAGDTPERPKSPSAISESSSSAVDVDEILAADLDALAVFPTNRDDPYLAADAEACAAFDEEELHDLVVRPTDALVLAARSGEDASLLEVHLLEDAPEESDDERPGQPAQVYQPHFYVHHDVVLPTLPLCTAVTSLPRGGGAAGADPVNLVAVGCFTPGIEVWDVDLVNVLEPVAVLGGYIDPRLDDTPIAVATSVAEKVAGVGGSSASGSGVQETRQANGAVRGSKKKTKKKKRPKLRLREGSHTDAVMSLSWNFVQREYLASGSADATVKIWDVESSHCARTLSHHSDKVQAVAWHPQQEAALATGAFDGTVQLCDVRAPESPAHTAWNVAADVESVQWGGIGSALEGKVVAATEDGMVSVFDPRRKGEAVMSWRAHKGAASALVISHDVPGLLVTASVEKTVKVWDTGALGSGPAADADAATHPSAPELVYERRSKAGAVFSAALCPLVPQEQAPNAAAASPFQLAYGGAKGVLVVSDLAVESEAVRERFAKFARPEAREVISRRAARNKSAAGVEAGVGKGSKGRKAKASKEGMRDVDESDGSSSGSSSDSSGSDSSDGESGLGPKEGNTRP